MTFANRADRNGWGGGHLDIIGVLAAAAFLMLSCAHADRPPVASRPPATDVIRRCIENVAYMASVRSSQGSGSRYKAIDGDIDTWWTAGDFAPQWIEFRFHQPCPVTGVSMIVSKVAPGPARHEVRMEREGRVVVWHRFDADMAADGARYSLRIDPARPVDRVRILTTRQEGWVAWREVLILAEAPSSETEPGLLSRPVQLTHAGDGSGRVIIVEKAGRIRIMRDGQLVERPFLDISGRIWEAYYEQGLFNIAFPPSYRHSRRFYVSYSDLRGDTVISRFATTSDPDLADADSEEIVLVIKQKGADHNGGTLRFGPRDGYLYIASGDGLGTRRDAPPMEAQDAGAPVGKILRIDVEAGVHPYAIPPDNPFASEPGHAPEVWALGLRNPWGMAFDRQSGALYIPDTGWERTEEVNFQPAESRGGENYGWPVWEGDVRTGFAGPDNEFVMPAAVYDRREGCAVVGGAVLQGQFIYGDFCTGRIWLLKRGGEGGWESRLLTALGLPVSSIGTDEAGNLYAVGYADGKIHRLEIAPASE